MKNEILDTPFLDTFEDFLDKDEKILWTGFTAENVDSIYIRNKDGSYSLNYGKLFLKILDFGMEFLTAVLIIGTPIAFYIFVEPATWKMYVPIIILFLLNFFFHYFIKNRRNNEYAITSKRILFQFARLPKNEIHQVLFSELKDCIVTLDKDHYGVIFLAAKNPQNLPDQLFEMDRHSPTLERIENPEEVAKIIRAVIRNA